MFIQILIVDDVQFVDYNAKLYLSIKQSIKNI